MRRAKSLHLWVSFQSRCMGQRQRVFLGGGGEVQACFPRGSPLWDPHLRAVWRHLRQLLLRAGLRGPCVTARCSESGASLSWERPRLPPAGCIFPRGGADGTNSHFSRASDWLVVNFSPIHAGRISKTALVLRGPLTAARDRMFHC